MYKILFQLTVMKEISWCHFLINNLYLKALKTFIDAICQTSFENHSLHIRHMKKDQHCDLYFLLYIFSSQTTKEVITLLLKKFHILDHPHKFALYEQELKNNKIGMVILNFAVKERVALLQKFTILFGHF